MLLHGQPGTGRDWDAVAERLADRHRVIAPDRRGYGRTGGGATDLAGNAVDVVTLLDDLGVARATVVGHSWGGGVALALAQDHPDRVEGLVLVASIGTRSAVAWTDRLLGVPALGEALSFVGFQLLGRFFVDDRTRKALAPDSDVVPEHTSNVRLAVWRSDAVWRSFAREQRAFLAATPHLQSRLRQVRAPTTVVVGQKDDLVPPRVGEELAAAIHGARLVRVPGAGHLLPFEAPDRVAQAVEDTITRTVLGPPRAGQDTVQPLPERDS